MFSLHAPDITSFSIDTSNERIQARDYSVMLVFTFDVVIQNISVSGHTENCSVNTTSFTKAAIFECRNLNSIQRYAITFQGMVKFPNDTFPLEFVVPFITKNQGNEHTSGSIR